MQNSSKLNQIECNIEGKTKYLLISKSEFKDENDAINTIYVIRDLTNQKLLEDHWLQVWRTRLEIH